jgi:hypothetical protein
MGLTAENLVGYLRAEFAKASSLRVCHLARALRYNSAKIAQRGRIMANPNPVPKFQKGHKKPEGSGRKAGQVNLELGVEPTTYTGQ